MSDRLYQDGYIERPFPGSEVLNSGTNLVIAPVSSLVVDNRSTRRLTRPQTSSPNLQRVEHLVSR
jgi:hypothetical protein